MRPLGVVSAAVRRFGEGDPKARADVRGSDEIAEVAAEFNSMAERLDRYRASSLGELLQAQQAAQAAIDGLADPVLLLDGTGKLQGRTRAASSCSGSTLNVRARRLFAGMDPASARWSIACADTCSAARAPTCPRVRGGGARAATPGASACSCPRATPIYGEDGTVTGAAIVLQDITRLFRFDELKNDLVATVAHEFRTPLTSLRMALHLSQRRSSVL